MTILVDQVVNDTRSPFAERQTSGGTDVEHTRGPVCALEGNRSRETSQCRVLGDERVVFAQLESPLREKGQANLSTGLTSFERCVQ
jgi:hypothetical protein